MLAFIPDGNVERLVGDETVDAYDDIGRRELKTESRALQSRGYIGKMRRKRFVLRIESLLPGQFL